MAFYAYIMANRKNGALYAGHTDNIAARVLAHREGRGATHTSKYDIKRLVWMEAHDTRESAKTREYQIKKWKRDWKIRLIEETNPDWKDLWFSLNQ